MHGTQEIIQEALDLPVEERILIMDALLRSLNAPDAEVDHEWAGVASARRESLLSGATKSVPASVVFQKIQTRLISPFDSQKF